MAAKQTRRTISVALELFERLKAFADEHEISMAQVATQGIEAMLDGRVPLGLTPTVAFPVTTVIFEDVMNAAVRACTELDAVFTAAIDRMLDHLETPTTVWCRGCTQTIGDCRCARPRTSAQAVPR